VFSARENDSYQGFNAAIYREHQNDILVPTTREYRSATTI